MTTTTKCSICTHADRAAIDRAILGGESRRAVATRWSLSEGAVSRHRSHVAKTGTATSEVEATGVDEIAEMKARARDAAKRAKLQGDIRAELLAERERRQALELELRLGQERGRVQPLTSHPAWDVFMRKLDAVLCKTCIEAICESPVGGPVTTSEVTR